MGPGPSRAWLALACALTACGSLRRPAVEPGVERPSEPSLEEINRRWSGARCRLALPLEFAKGESGWTSSGGLYVARSDAGGAFYYQVLVSERETLDDLFDSRVLRPGTALVAEGWRFKKADANRGPYLELRFADRPARARVEFRGVRQFDFEGLPFGRLAQIEAYCRETLFKVSAPDASPQAAPDAPAPAAEPPAARPLPTPTPVPAPPQQPRPTPEPPAPPRLELTRVAVTPNPAPRGGDAELVAVYSVNGLPPGSSVEVLERREVLRGGTTILSTEDRYDRPAASFTSAKPLRFSWEAEVGSYLLRVTLEANGARAEGTAVFELR